MKALSIPFNETKRYWKKTAKPLKQFYNSKAVFKLSELLLLFNLHLYTDFINNLSTLNFKSFTLFDISV